MKMLVSALISKFGTDVYNVTMLYGDVDSTLIPVSAPEIQKSAITEMACNLTRELVLSSNQLPEGTYLYNSKTTGSMRSATTVDANVVQAESNQFILASIEKIGYNELTALFKKLTNVLSTSAFSGKFEYCNTFTKLRFEKS